MPIYYPLILFELLLLLLLPPALRAGEVELAQEAEVVWQGDDIFLLFGGTLLVGALTAFDQDLRLRVKKNDSGELTSIARGADLIGHPIVVVGAAGALWAGGVLNRDREWEVMGRKSLQAVTAAEALTVGLKLASGRNRPGKGNSDFQWGACETERDSFPSGHTAGAFALASSLAESSRDPMTARVAYTFAGGIGISRLIVDEHWGSDVVAGALIGELCGRIMPKLLDNSNLALSPVLTAQGSSLNLTLAW